MKNFMFAFLLGTTLFSPHSLLAMDEIEDGNKCGAFSSVPPDVIKHNLCKKGFSFVDCAQFSSTCHTFYKLFNPIMEPIREHFRVSTFISVDDYKEWSIEKFQDEVLYSFSNPEKHYWLQMPYFKNALRSWAPNDEQQVILELNIGRNIFNLELKEYDALALQFDFSKENGKNNTDYLIARHGFSPVGERTQMADWFQDKESIFCCANPGGGCFDAKIHAHMCSWSKRIYTVNCFSWNGDEQKVEASEGNLSREERHKRFREEGFQRSYFLTITITPKKGLNEEEGGKQ